MRVKVTDSGVVIPRELLEGVEEVEIRQEHGIIKVIPTGRHDPIWGLGKNPVEGGLTDASENHDRYIYGI
jgi:hypothetical protein